MMDNRELQLEHRLTMLEIQVKALENVPDKLDMITEKLAKYDSRWGMLLMIGTALWALFSTFKDNIIHFIKG